MRVAAALAAFGGLFPPCGAAPPPAEGAGDPGDEGAAARLLALPDFSSAARLLEDAVAGGAFPGCAVAAGTSREVLWCRGFGTLDLSGDTPAEAGTLYDLASLTKVIGATSVAIALVRDGRLEVSDPLAKHVPGFIDAAAGPEDRALREEVTIAHLLAHASGLPAWRPLFREADTYAGVLAAALATPLEARPGERARYSDVGLILLGEALARAGGKPLAELERDLVFRPLGMRHTLRRPPGAWKPWIAPTEVVAGGAIHGVVHDENARAAEGLTGHAGLFSSAGDVAVFAGELLRGRRGESSVFPRDLVRRFTSRAGLVAGSSRALGWDTPSGRSSAGDLLSRRSFGHTGFTGTSVWIDPHRDLYAVLLSNRVHPTRASTKVYAVRRALADAVARAFDEVSAPGAPSGR